MHLVRAFWRALIVSAWALPLSLGAANEATQNYHLPAGEAPVTLRLFSDASGRELLFAAETVRGIRTNPVRGRLTPPDALERMLDGTVLTAILDERSGAFAIGRREITAIREPAVRK